MRRNYKQFKISIPRVWVDGYVTIKKVSRNKLSGCIYVPLRYYDKEFIVVLIPTTPEQLNELNEQEKLLKRTKRKYERQEFIENIEKRTTEKVKRELAERQSKKEPKLKLEPNSNISKLEKRLKLGKSILT